MLKDEKMNVFLRAGLVFMIFTGSAYAVIKNSITLTSTSFSHDQQMDKKYTCDGQNISPHLAWFGVPRKTKSLVLTCCDPDAPAGIWTHWVLFDIAPTTNEVLEAVIPDGQCDNGARQGINDFGKIGYGGACPPRGGGTHHYIFTLYALDCILGLDAGSTRAQVEQELQNHVLATGTLTGIYAR